MSQGQRTKGREKTLKKESHVQSRRDEIGEGAFKVGKEIKCVLGNLRKQSKWVSKCTERRQVGQAELKAPDPWHCQAGILYLKILAAPKPSPQKK